VTIPSDLMQCGHPKSDLVSSDEGTSYCAGCDLDSRYEPTIQLYTGDCIDIMKRYVPTDSIDLVFGSPPYEDARTYGLDNCVTGQAWVDWMVSVVVESLRVCTGLTAFVVEGRTRKYAWSCTPALLIADLHRAGIAVRKPPIFHRSGIPGCSGPDWLRNDYEIIVCATRGGPLPWSNNTAMGSPPKCKPGGDLTNRLADGRRVRVAGAPTMYFGKDRGDYERTQKYIPPAIANPGNVIRTPGGHVGSKLAHENEAPFPEGLAEFFIRSFCPPDGWVLDPFSGSGTTAAVALRCHRNAIGIDIRKSQTDLAHRRIQSERIPTVQAANQEAKD